MTVRPEQTWQHLLEQIVSTVLAEGHAEPGLVEAGFELARKCDPATERDVVFVCNQMLKLAAHLRDLNEHPWAADALSLAVELGVNSYVQMSSPDLILGLARYLRHEGQSEMAEKMLEAALRPDIVAAADAGPDSASRIWNLRGELLRDMGEYDGAIAAFASSLEMLANAQGGGNGGQATVLNNLGLAHIGKGELEQGRDYLIQSLEVGNDREPDRLDIALTLDNLGAVETDLAVRCGPYQLGENYVNMPTAEHLTQAEHYFDQARELFESELPRSAEDYAIALLNICRAVGLRAEPDALNRMDALTARALELAEQHRMARSTIWTIVKMRGEVLLQMGQPQAAVDLMGPWFESLWASMEPHERISESLTTLLRASALAQDDPDVMASIAESIISIDDQLLARRLMVGSEAEVRNLFADYMARAQIVLGHCLPAAASGQAAPWLVELVLNRKGVLAERQGSAWLQARLAEGTRVELFNRIRELRSEISGIDLDGTAAEAIALARHQHAEAERKLGQLEAQLHRELGAGMVPVPRVTMADLQASIPPGTLMLEIAKMTRPDGSLHYVSFLVCRRVGPVAVRGPGGRADAKTRGGVGAQDAPGRQAAKARHASHGWACGCKRSSSVTPGDDTSWGQSSAAGGWDSIGTRRSWYTRRADSSSPRRSIGRLLAPTGSGCPTLELLRSCGQRADTAESNSKRT
jgi:tetratricopeptide (TPR) repeat protein